MAPVRQHQHLDRPVMNVRVLFCTVADYLKLKLKTNLHSTIKCEDSEALDGGTSRLSSQREYGEIKYFEAVTKSS